MEIHHMRLTSVEPTGDACGRDDQSELLRSVRRYNSVMENHGGSGPPPEPDHGLKRLLTYTVIALVLAVIAALVAAALVVRFVDTAG